MEPIWIATAFFLGLLALRLGLPALVGHLAAGYLLFAFGVRSSPVLQELGQVGVLLLLFTVGLKLRLKDLLSLRVLGVGGAELLLFGGLAYLAFGEPTVSVALAFSSTVLAAKMLESKKELGTYHGRLVIGILVLQDLSAVALLTLATKPRFSPWLPALLLLPLLRHLLGWLLKESGWEELLVLFGLAAALGGGKLFWQLGLTPELGALIVGSLLSDHHKGSELARALWSIKGFFLVAFFLHIGLEQGLAGVDLGVFLLLMALALTKAPIFFFLFLRAGLRARTSFVNSVYLSSYSEFAIILIAGLASRLDPSLFPTIALAVAVTMALSSTAARSVHPFFRRWEARLVPFERRSPHPDAEPVKLQGATVLVVGMGRTGGAVYRALETQGQVPLGLDADPSKIEKHKRKGRRVLYGDAEDPELWERIDLSGVKSVVLTLPDLEAKLLAARWLRERGFTGLLAATSFHLEEDPLLTAAGVNFVCHPFREAGEKLAENVLEKLQRADQDNASCE